MDRDEKRFLDWKMAQGLLAVPGYIVI